ncbi:hypothetical protein EON81_06695 [bacterium]|nr:MAG: hypothetical protein EON81_06695 [bacterium]
MNRIVRGLLFAVAGVATLLLGAAILFPIFVKEKANPRRAEMRAWNKKRSNLMAEAVQAMEKGDEATVERICRLAIDKTPKDSWFSLFLAHLYEKQGRDKDALIAYGRAIPDFGPGSEYATSPKVLIQYGDLLEKNGQREKAAKAYRLAKGRSPEK